MSNLLKIWSRWEANPPILNSPECRGALAPVVERLREQLLLRAVAPAAAFTCTECGERRPLTFLTDDGGKTHAFIHCHCGVSPVAEELLQRWELDSTALLGAMFRSIQVSLQQRVAGQLWQIGKARWVGGTREVWFVRSFQRAYTDPVVRALKSRPKAILFTPLETTAIRWQEFLTNPIIAIETAVTWDAKRFDLDADYVESRLVDVGLGAKLAKGRRPPKKRAERAAGIERLTAELIKHMSAAKGHARFTEDQTGEPELLPRPTQKAFGERVNLSESAASRCFGDPSAKELRIYWNAAVDLEEIQRWRGPISTGHAKSGRSG